MINTVTGPVKKDELGVTLSHEHLYCDTTDAMEMYYEKKYDDKKIEDMYNELLPVLKKLYQAGCRAIAETSSPDGGQNLLLMQKLSRASGIKLIPSTGMVNCNYEEDFKIHGEGYEKKIAKRMIKDFEDGLDNIDGVTIRPSHIKIFINGKTLSQIDKKILEASVLASKSTGLPIHCHILNESAAIEIIRLLEEKNFDFTKFLWAHVGYDDKFEFVDEAVSKGVWLGFDIIQQKNYDKYCSMIKKAIENGYKDRVLLSQDYDFFEQVGKSKDNHPCASLLTDFIPYCEEKGISKDTIMDILTNNPADFYNI